MRSAPFDATELPATPGVTNYPDPFAAQVAGRTKRKLGDCFGLTHFGVNLTQLASGAVSALAHHHAVQDEFIFVIAGHPTLILAEEEFELAPNSCVGFKAGAGAAHQLVNRTAEVVSYLEIGDRGGNDAVEYPNDDLKAVFTADGTWLLTHKDGSPY